MNENCLKGISCPKCKAEDEFIIYGKCRMVVHDDGVEDTSEHEWGDDATIMCSACGETGTVGKFYKNDDELFSVSLSRASLSALINAVDYMEAKLKGGKLPKPSKDLVDSGLEIQALLRQIEYRKSIGD